MSNTISPLGESITLLSILPGGHTQREKSQQLQIKMQQYHKVILLAIDALNALQARQLHKFDPLVGENACQIRSVMHTDLAQQETLGDQIIQCLTELNEASKNIHDQKKIDNNTSFERVLVTHNLLLKLPKMLIAATLSYQLWMTKVSEISFMQQESVIVTVPKENTDPKKLIINKQPVELKFAQRIDKEARKLLSQWSVEYVQGLAKNLPKSAEVSELKELVANVREDGNGRKTIPCFAFMDILLRSAQQKNIPILLKVGVVDPQTLQADSFIPLLYTVEDQGYVYKENFDLLQNSQAVIVMEGYSMGSTPLSYPELLEKLRSIPLDYNVLGNDAAHHQYAGDKKDVHRPKSARCEHFRTLALNNGFCKENPTLCYIDHVYADTIEHQKLTIWKEL